MPRLGFGPCMVSGAGTFHLALLHLCMYSKHTHTHARVTSAHGPEPGRNFRKAMQQGRQLFFLPWGAEDLVHSPYIMI